MKKVLRWCLALLLVMMLAACGSSETTNNTSEPKNNESTNVTTKEQSEKQETTTAGQELIFEEFTPIDNDECAITLKKLDPDDIFGYTVKAVLENKSSDITYMFSVSTASVNGVEVDPLFAAEVAPGKKANEDITILNTDLEENGIKDYTDIELMFRVYDTNDWNAQPVVDESVHIYPYGEDKATTYVREQKDSDQVLVDNDKVTVLIIDKVEDPIWGYTLKLFIVNKTDAEIMVSVDEASVNGFMADPLFAKSVQGGKCTFASISWADYLLEENDITDIENIEFKLKVYDYNNWKDYCDEAVTVTP